MLSTDFSATVVSRINPADAVRLWLLNLVSYVTTAMRLNIYISLEKFPFALVFLF